MYQKSIHTVYVLNKDNKPLMPTRPAKAKWLMKNSKAKVACRSPFTIRLTYQIKEPILQPASLAFDDGETVGVVVIQKNKTHQRVVLGAQMRCRGKEVKDLLSQRQRLRKARRKRRWQRRQKKRFKRGSATALSTKQQKLPPSVLADIEAKMRLLNKIRNIIPISEIRWEPLALSIEKQKTNRKNAPRLLPPYLQENKHRLAYQLSEKKRRRVIQRDSERCCICCRNVNENTAYIYSLHRVGFNLSGIAKRGYSHPVRGIDKKSRHGDLLTLCHKCSLKIQDERFVISLDPLKFSSVSGAARVMHGKNELGRRLKAIGLPIFLVNGWRTGQCRKKLSLSKSHLNDAVAIGSRGEKCLLMENFYLVRLRARHQRKLFFENKGDHDIQRIRKEMVKDNDHQQNKKSRSIRRRVRRKLYQKRYGKGGVKNKRTIIGSSSEPFSPYDAICVTKSGERLLIGNRKIKKNQELPKLVERVLLRGVARRSCEERSNHEEERRSKAKQSRSITLPRLKEIAKLFQRGDIVKTAEGILAEVVTLFASGKVGIQFLAPQEDRKPKRTARIPERLSLVSRGKTMQFVQLPIE